MNRRAFVVAAFFAGFSADCRAGPAIVRGGRGNAGGDDLVGTIVNLVSDKDEPRSGFSKCASRRKDRKRLCNSPPYCRNYRPTHDQGLLDALADRGDKAARPAVLDLLGSQDKSVHDAALRAGLARRGGRRSASRAISGGVAVAGKIDSLGQPDSPAGPGHRLRDRAADGSDSENEPRFDRDSRGTAGHRHGSEVAAAENSDATVRKAAMACVGELAKPSNVAGMLAGRIESRPGEERDAAEKSRLARLQSNQRSRKTGRACVGRLEANSLKRKDNAVSDARPRRQCRCL